MAYIPMGKANRIGAATAAPSVNPSKYGVVGDAMERLGNAVNNIGQDLLEKQVRSNENDYLLKTSAADMEAMQEFRTQKMASMGSAEDAVNYSVDADKFIKDRVAENLKNAPTPRARQEYEKTAARFFTREFLDVKMESHKYQGLYKEKSITDTSDSFASSQVVAPNFEKAIESIGLLNKTVDENDQVLFTPEHGMKIKEKVANTVAVASFQGFLQNDSIDRNLYVRNLENGIKELQKEGEGSVAYYLDPKQKAALLGQYNNALKQEHQKEATYINRELNDIQAALKVGVPVPNSQIQGIEARLNQAKNSGFIDPDTHARMSSTARVVGQASSMIANLKNTPASEWPSTDGLISGGTFNMADKAQAKSIVDSMKASELKRRYEDFPAYAAQGSQKISELQKQAMGGDPLAISNYIREVDAKANVLGVPQSARRVLSEQFSAYIGQQLNAAPNAETKAQLLSSWQQAFGQDWNKAASELVKDKHVSGDVLVAGFIPNKSIQSKVLANTMNSTQLKDLFKKTNPNTSDGAILDNVGADYLEVSDYLIGRSGDPSNSAFASALLDQVVLETKRRANAGESISSAAKSAYNDIIESSFDKVAGGTSKLLLPKGTDVEAVEEFLDLAATKSGIEMLELAPAGSGLDKNDELLSFAQKSFWDVTPDRSSIGLYIHGPDGLPYKVLNKNKQPMVIKLNEIDTYRGRLRDSKLAREEALKKNAIPGITKLSDFFNLPKFKGGE